MPFCPGCRSEYRPELSHCADCGLDLVPALPESRPAEPDLELVEVHQTWGEIDAQLIRAQLESAGIDSILRGEAIRFIHGFNLNNLAKVKILVRADEADEARSILSELPENFCAKCGAAAMPGVDPCPACGYSGPTTAKPIED